MLVHNQHLYQKVNDKNCRENLVGMLESEVIVVVIEPNRKPYQIKLYGSNILNITHISIAFNGILNNLC